MQLELVLPLRDHRDHAGVVRARADLVEPDLLAGDEQLDPEHALAAQVLGDGPGDLLGALARDRRHRVRLPALDVVAPDLAVPDGLAEGRADLAVRAARANRELSDLVVEVDERLDDHAPAGDPAAGHRVVPGGPHAGRVVDPALALAGAAHHGLDHARVADPRCAGTRARAVAVDRRDQLGERVAEPVRARGQPEGFGGKAADALAVHREPGRARRRDHPHDPLGLELGQHRGGDGLDLRHDDVRLLGEDQCTQLGGVAHVDRARVVGDLVTRGARVPVDGDRLDPEALQRDHDLLAELTGAQEHHARGRRRVRGAEGLHGGSPCHAFDRDSSACQREWALTLVRS